MPVDIYLLPCSLSFTLGIVSILWPDVLREFAWRQYRSNAVRSMGRITFVLGLLCWTARGSCYVEDVAGPFCMILIAAGLLLILVPSLGLWSLRSLVCARPARIRLLGLVLIVLGGLLLSVTRPGSPAYLSHELFAWHLPQTFRAQLLG